MMRELYTIGHSTHPIDKFLALLKEHVVTAIGDVRSQPYSEYNPQFNRESLKQILNNNNIVYVFLGAELGARTTNLSCYHEGRVQYARLANTHEFKAGIDRLNKGMDSYRIALMCAEKDPITCHRTILICRYLRANNLVIKHILEDGSLETQQAAEQRLMDTLHIPKQDMFMRLEQLIELAYDRQNQKIAYTQETT